MNFKIEDIFLYSLSTIPQVLAAVIAISSVFVLKKNDYLNGQIKQLADIGVMELDKHKGTEDKDLIRRKLTGAMHNDDVKEMVNMLKDISKKDERFYSGDPYRPQEKINVDELKQAYSKAKQLKNSKKNSYFFSNGCLELEP